MTCTPQPNLIIKKMKAPQIRKYMSICMARFPFWTGTNGYVPICTGWFTKRSNALIKIKFHGTRVDLMIATQRIALTCAFVNIIWSFRWRLSPVRKEIDSFESLVIFCV